MEAPPRNVVLFGACGVGKSSVIRAIHNPPLVGTLASSGDKWCTEDSASYLVSLDTGIKIHLRDNICADDTMFSQAGLSQEQYLKRSLQKQMIDGIDLLLYCVQGANGAESLPVKRCHWESFKFVFEEVCQRRVPVAMIVTYLESYDPSGDMDSWWMRNEQKISEFGFQLCAHACITVLPPENGGDASRFEVSRRRLRDLLSRNYLAPRNVLLLGDREDRYDFINMITSPRNKQNSDDRAESVSPFTCVPAAFDGHTYANLWNMSGSEETGDDASALVTEKKLKHIVQGIKQILGIDLLVFCFHTGRLKIRHARAYNFFYAAICRKKVPVAIVILGPEESQTGDNSRYKEKPKAWWERNQDNLRKQGFLFDKHIYIPCNPRRLPSDSLDSATRHRFINLVQEEYISGSWNVGDDPFWVTVPNVHAVIGELSWPTTTVVICDATRDTFIAMEPGVHSSLLASDVSPKREHRFHKVDLPTTDTSSGNIQSRTVGQVNKGFGLIVFFMRAEKPDDETWGLLDRFYSVYKGAVTPFIVVVCGLPDRKAAEDFWRAAPRHIRRRIGAYPTYYPGPDATLEARVAAQEIMAEMIQHRCLVDLGEKVGILQGILSVWRKYRSQHKGLPDRAVR